LGHALVLDATYEPLGVVTDRRALLLVLATKATEIESSGRLVRSAGAALPVPAVIRLNRYVRVPHRAGVPLTRRAVFARDGGRCAYCGGQAASIDHVVPRSRGGRHTWDNVVAACHRCNRTKADRSPADLGWRLRWQPAQPTGSAWRVLASGRHDPVWLPYLVGHGLSEASALTGMTGMTGRPGAGTADPGLALAVGT
jgi:5-methylcytosine-specific restriction endonuclease McrA